MLTRSTLFLLGSTCLSAAALAAPSPIPPILAGAPTAAQINQRCDMVVQQSTTMRTALENSRDEAKVDTTLLAYDQLFEVIVNGVLESTLYREVSPSAESRAAGEACEVKIGIEGNKLQLSRPIYDRLKAVKVPAD